MAVEPLFASSKDQLLSEVRIKSATDEQTLDLVDVRIRDVRNGFYDRLGEGRIGELLSYPQVENPTSSTERQRSKADSAEVTWLTILLMEELPVLFMDDSDSVNQKYNEEPLTRDSDPEVINRLKDRLDDLLTDLDEDKVSGSRGFKASAVGPDTKCILTSNFPGLRTGRSGGCCFNG